MARILSFSDANLAHMIRAPIASITYSKPWAIARDVLTLTEMPTPPQRGRVLVGVSYRGKPPLT